MSPDTIMGRLLAALAVTLLVVSAMRWAVRAFRQPTVVADILTGVVLGPTVLGWLWPGATAWLFPPEIIAALRALGIVGLVIFVLATGLQLEWPPIKRGYGQTIGRIAVGAFCLPAALALAVVPVAWSRHEVPGVSSLAFAVLVATAIAVTAFPVLLRMIETMDFGDSPAPYIAAAVSALLEPLIWLLLLVALTLEHPDLAGVARSVAVVAGLIAALALLRRSRAGAWISRGGRLDPPGVQAVCLCTVALAAGATQLVNLHAAIGAFLVGLLWPRSLNGVVEAELVAGMRPLTDGLLLPIYFLTPGLTLSLGAIDPLLVALFLAAAMGGKLIGAVVPARWSGLSWRDSSVVAVLLNTRGMVELVVLNVGLSAGILAAKVYGALVVVALVTTMSTGVLASALGVRGALRRSPLTTPAAPVPAPVAVVGGTDG